MTVKAASPSKSKSRRRAPAPVTIPRLRLLPVMIFAAVAMLTVRVGGMVEGLSSEQGAETALLTVEANRAMAADPMPADDAQVAQLPPGDADDPARRDPNASLLPEDDFSAAEVQVLERLRERRDAIASKEADLVEREALLRAAESKVDRKIDELRDLESSIAALLKQYDAQEQAQIDSLVKIYSSMKPKEAAPIFDELDMDILLKVIDNMKERKSAPIIARMNPDRVSDLTARLADHNRLGDQARAAVR